MAFKITEKSELYSLLGKAYWLESQLEGASQWEAYLLVKEQKHMDILFKISHDSEAHRSIINLLSYHLEGFDVEKAASEIKEERFNFKKMHVEEIMAEIMRYEMLAHDLYSRILDHTSEDLIKKLWNRKSYEEYFKLMKWLVNQEEGHIKLLQPYAGKIKRIL
ncbi:MAG: hypothetical protein A7315_07870 [Candidatus Altiarchaeales archaeon WOR_SM1_79]|nr:MAG: hypothetical protein A7315_07870 [Candidatus Altiarchaeales archaeon WOR_SM1_79]